MDFENLDEKEREKLMLEQEESRKNVLKKWRMILFIKKHMRFNVKRFKEKKKALEAENVKNTLRSSIGFRNFISSKFHDKFTTNRQTLPENDQNSSRGLIEKYGQENS